MIVLHNIYGLNPGDCRYRSKLKKMIEQSFSSQLLFVTAKANTAEIVISQSVFQNGLHHSVDKKSSIVEVASVLRADIIAYCSNLPELSWPPKIKELEEIEAPDSVKLFLTSLFSPKKHSIEKNENVKRLINSYAADMIHGVTFGKCLTKKHYLLAMGLHSMTGIKNVVKILNKLGHCMSYDKTCEIETSIAETTMVRAHQGNILPVVSVQNETVLTYFWVDNFDINMECQKGGGSIHTTHLMAFQESSDGLPNNTNQEVTFVRSKRRKITPDNEVNIPLPIINKNQEPPKFENIISTAYSPSKFSSLYVLWLCLRKWNSFDQTVPNFTGWLLKVREKRFQNEKFIKTLETYLPPIVTKVTEYASIQKYIQYLQSLAASVNMPYTSITLDMGAAINAFKFVWNDNDAHRDVFIHLGSFHFIKENFQVSPQPCHYYCLTVFADECVKLFICLGFLL